MSVAFIEAATERTPTNTLDYYLLYIFILVILYIAVMLLVMLIKNRYESDKLDNVTMDYYGKKEGKQVVIDILTTEQKELRWRFLLVSTVIKASAWVKAPYVFALFNRLHGFTRADIGILWSIDSVSSLFFGPIIGSLSDMYGRRKFCLIYCVVVISHIALRLTGSIPLAYVVQVLSGVSTCLIDTVFESWLNFEASFLFHVDEDGIREKNAFLREIFAKYQFLFIFIGK
jgi:hypothetical protein